MLYVNAKSWYFYSEWGSYEYLVVPIALIGGMLFTQSKYKWDIENW